MELRQEIHNLFAEIRKDPENFTCLKTDELLAAYNKETNAYLDDKTTLDIEKGVRKSLELDNCYMRLSNMEKYEIYKRLVGYRFVDQLDELHVGKFTRWIQKYPLSPSDTEFKYKVQSGGFLSSIDFTDNGVVLTIKMWNRKFYKITFDHCLVYQKLSVGEELILMTADYIKGT